MMAHAKPMDKFISARTWAARWDCSLSTVRRVAQRCGVRRVYVGTGPNGLVRYSLADIAQIERDGSFQSESGLTDYEARRSPVDTPSNKLRQSGKKSPHGDSPRRQQARRSPRPSERGAVRVPQSTIELPGNG